MRTPRTGARIPTLAACLLTTALLGSCGSEDDTDATNNDAAVTTVASGATVATVAAETSESSPSSSTAPSTTRADTSAFGEDVAAAVRISVTAGVDSSETRIEAVSLGSTVTLTVINPDRDDEFHVHGYELGDGIEVPTGQPEIFTFVADQAGEFAVESHTTHDVLLVLVVG